MTNSELESCNAKDIEGTFEEIVTSRKRKKLGKVEGSVIPKKRATFDSEFYVPYKPTDDNYEKG